MNNKLLHQVSAEAKGSYSQHKIAAKELGHSRQSQRTSYMTGYSVDSEAAMNARAENIALAHKQVAVDQGNYDLSVSDAAQFARENMEQLHDLAVIEAHLGGVAINVQQPLTIGEQVEVRKI